MAVGFNAQADRLQTSAPPSGSGAFTVIGFAYIATDRNDYTTLIGFEGSGGVFRTLQTDSDGVTLTVFDSTLGSLFNSPPVLSTGQWYAVALRYDSSRNGTLDVMPIGGSKSTYSSNNAATSLTFTTATLAGNEGFATEFLNGHLRSWRMWDVRLTDGEVDAEFESLNAVKTSDLRSEYRLVNNSAYLTDSSGNGRTLTNPGGSGTWTTESDPSVQVDFIEVTTTKPTLSASGGTTVSGDSPTVISKGTASAATSGTVTPSYPASPAADDIIFLLAISHQPNGIGVINTPSGGWAEVAQGTYRNNSSTDQGRAALFWLRSAGSESGTVSVTRTGDTGTDGTFFAQMYLVRGCRTSGNPYTNATARYGPGSATITWDSVDPAGHNRLLLAFTAQADDAPGGSTPSGYARTVTIDTTTTGTDAQLVLDDNASESSGPQVTASNGETLGWATFHVAAAPVDGITRGTSAVTSAIAAVVASGSVGSSGTEGTVAVTTPIATLTSSGTPVQVGTFAVTSPVPALDADGSAASEVEGTVAVTTAVPTLDADGVLGVGGTLAATGPGASISAAGTTAVVGTAAIAVPVPAITQRTRALGFNAYNDGLVYAGAPNNDLYTARMWVRMAQSSNGGAQMSPFSIEDTTQPQHTINSIFTRLSPNLGQYELHEDRDVGGIGGFAFTSTIGVNVWVYLAITQDIGTGRTRLFWRRENDANVQYDEWTGLASYSSAMNRVIVGTCDASDQNEFFIGGIAAVALWSGRELSPAEIQTDSQTLHPQDLDSLWAYWPLQTAAAKLTDISGNARHLTEISGSGTWTELADGPQVTTGSLPGSGGAVTATTARPTLSAAGTTSVVATASVTATRPALVATGATTSGFGPVRLLPQGDSITDGPNGSYRDILHRRLTAAGFTVDFVGHRVDQYPASGQPDLDHSGTPGYTIGGLQSEWPTRYAAYNPNATIVMAGTNDMAWWTAMPGDAVFAADGQPASCHAQVLDRFVTAIRASNPSILVFVCTIAPMSSQTIDPNGWNRADLAVAFNNAIRTKVVPPRQAAGQRVYLLDANAQLDLGDLYDGIHPTKEALDGVAEYMAPIVIAALNSVAPVQPVGAVGVTTPKPSVAAVGLGDPPTTISGTVAVTTTKPTVAAYDVPVAYGAVPAVLPAQLLIGFFEEAQDDWMTTTGRDWDVRYRYLTYRWADNWGFGPLDGAFAYGFLTETRTQGYTPCVTYYAMHEMASSTGRVGWEADWLNKLQTPGIMAEYFTHVRILMQRCVEFGDPVIIHVEPDGLGFLQQQTGGNPQAYAAIAASGLSELAGLPNTVAGWGQAWLAMREATGADNVVLGTHVSGWASGEDIIHFGVTAPLQTHVDTVYNFMAPTGILPNVTGSTYDVLVGDPLDRDADYYQLIRGENRWWDPSPSAPINSRSFNRYVEWTRLWNVKAGLRWMMWQIPCGTNGQRNVSYDGTQGSGYRDNRSEYFFGTSGAANRQKWIDAGTIALLFGHGQGEQTHPWVDYGYLRDNAVLGHAVPRGQDGSGEPVDNEVLGTLARTTTTPTVLAQGAVVLHVGTVSVSTPVASLVASGPGGLEDSFFAATTPMPAVVASGTPVAACVVAVTTSTPSLSTAGAATVGGTVAVTTPVARLSVEQRRVGRGTPGPSKTRATTSLSTGGRNRAVTSG